MSRKADEIAERVASVVSERMEAGGDIERLETEINYLKTHRISEVMKREFKRLRIQISDDVKELIEKQRELEENALKVWGKELEKLKKKVNYY